MLKHFALPFAAAFFALFVWNFVNVHIQEVSGFDQVIECAQHDCYEVGNAIYVVK